MPPPYPGGEDDATPVVTAWRGWAGYPTDGRRHHPDAGGGVHGNLTTFAWGELALKLEPLIAARARKNQVASGGAVPQKSAEPVDTRAELARIAGVSHDTISKTKVRAERRGGELLGEMPRANKTDNLKRGPKSLDVTSGPELADLGITKMQSSRWQAIASLPEPSPFARGREADLQAVTMRA